MSLTRAMITIEVLIAMLILFLVIVTSTTSIKFFYITNKKKEEYQNSYIAVLSIKDKISNKICRDNQIIENTFNGIKYKASCKKLYELNNYQLAFDLGDKEGNIGKYLLKLYKVTLYISNKNYIYYINRIERSF